MTAIFPHNFENHSSFFNIESRKGVQSKNQGTIRTPRFSDDGH